MLKRQQPGQRTPEIFSKARLEYEVEESHKLTPVWTMYFRTGDSQLALSRVNAVTGETLVRSDLLPDDVLEDFRVDICVRVTGDPSICGTADTYYAIREDNEGTDSCESPDCDAYWNVWAVATALEADWENAVGLNSAVCCHGIGGPDDRIEVIVNRPPATGYSTGTRNLYFTGGREQSAEAVAHEFSHSWIHSANPTLVSIGPSQLYAETFLEAIADVQQAILGIKRGTATHPYGFAGKMGDYWLYGDGPPALSAAQQRNHNVNYTFSQWNTLPASSHARAPVIGNFFKRLYDKGAMSPDRFNRLVLNFGKNLLPMQSGALQWSDFKRALADSVEPGEIALYDDINEVWNDMNDLPVPDWNVPWPPIYVSGSLATPACASDGTTRYNVQWNSVPDATHYYTMYESGGLWYPVGGANPTVFVSTVVHVPFNTRIKVRACNSHGCSGLSPSFVTTWDNC